MGKEPLQFTLQVIFVSLSSFFDIQNRSWRNEMQIESKYDVSGQ